MRLNTIFHDVNGKARGTVRLKLQFGQNTWSVEDDSLQAWRSAGLSMQGPFDVKGADAIWLWDQEPGKPKQHIVALSNVPTNENTTGTAGTGQIVAARKPEFSGARFFWAFLPPAMSEVRAKMIDILTRNVFPTGLSSDMPAFRDLTGFDTKRLKADYWDKVDSPDRNFTTCNAFLGTMARKLGAKPGSWLSRGVLELIRADKDVPGSWVTAESGASPQRGDFYSIPLTLESGWVQKFGHVGIIGKIEDGLWTSVDGGQGGRKAGIDYIKWVPRGKLEPQKLNGWIDLDRYFATPGTP